MRPDFVVFIHRIYIGDTVKKGGLDQILDYIKQIGKSLLILEFPLDYKVDSKIKITFHANQKDEVLRSFSAPFKGEIINWLVEFLYAIYFSVKYQTFRSIVISSDPLTSFPAIILRKLGFFKYHYYHSVDYSVNRFSDPILNYFYNA
jgi:hypothetical protein